MAFAFVVAATPVVAAPSTFAPGLFRQIDPATNAVLKVGNRVRITRTSSGKLAFDLRAVRRFDLNTGEIRGYLSVASRATVTQPGLKCRLYFTANDDGFVVSQDLEYGDCGEGYGVIASGMYVRAAR